jgi:hypothetical protein
MNRKFGEDIPFSVRVTLDKTSSMFAERLTGSALGKRVERDIKILDGHKIFRSCEEDKKSSKR